MEIEAMRARAADMEQRFERLRQNLSGLQRKIQEVQVTATSRDGFVKATVGPRGQLVKLELDPRIFRHPDSRELAATITDTVRRAAQESQDKIVELCRPFVAEDDVVAHMNVDFDSMMRKLDTELGLGGEV